MYASYSASKRHNSYKQPQFMDEPLTSRNSTMNRRSSNFEADYGRAQLATSRKVMPYKKKLQYEEEKENQTYAPQRQSKYVPIKRDSFRYVSPLKQPYSQTELAKSRRNTFIRKQLYEPQTVQNYPVEARPQYKVSPLKENYEYGNARYNKYNGNQKYQIYQNKQQSCELYQKQSEKKRTPAFKANYQVKQAQQYAYINNNNIKDYGNAHKTPPKYDLGKNELLQKSQFLRQRIQRINRMTPKGGKAKIEFRQFKKSVTPQKQQLKQSLQIVQNNYINESENIGKANKYNIERLRMQPIFDIQQLRQQSYINESEVNSGSGMQEINKLSRKISDRLNSIICRHAN